MALIPLAPDMLEAQCSLVSGKLPGCPFCGQNRLLMASAINEDMPDGQPLYQASIACRNLSCSASIICNERTRDAAQQGVIIRWSMRGGAAEEINNDNR